MAGPKSVTPGETKESLTWYARFGLNSSLGRTIRTQAGPLVGLIGIYARQGSICKEFQRGEPTEADILPEAIGRTESAVAAI